VAPGRDGGSGPRSRTNAVWSMIGDGHSGRKTEIRALISQETLRYYPRTVPADRGSARLTRTCRRPSPTAALRAIQLIGHFWGAVKQKASRDSQGGQRQAGGEETPWGCFCYPESFHGITRKRTPQSGGAAFKADTPGASPRGIPSGVRNCHRSVPLLQAHHKSNFTPMRIVDPQTGNLRPTSHNGTRRSARPRSTPKTPRRG
jgi:hypothetical protein